jgi:diguanylate cyclase (GGDEF)-like protein
MKLQGEETSPIAVLVAEDDLMFRHVLNSWLGSWGYEVTLAADGKRAWEILQNSKGPELLILDWVMPGLSGPELCGKLRERGRVPSEYIILLTSKREKQDVVRGLESGADDYICKPFDAQELRARVAVGKRVLRLQKDLVEARETAQFQATHDALTGLWNRPAILGVLQREVDRGARIGHAPVVMILDLDHCKNVNDRFGHLVGDAVLREVGSRLATSVRSYDWVGRYGGEEFLLIVSDCSAADARSYAERIRAALSARPIATTAGEVSATVSIGVAAGHDRQYSATEVLARADAALYSAKEKGRNCVAIADPG